MFYKFALLLLGALLLTGCRDTATDDTSGPTICPPADTWSYSGRLDVTPDEGSPFEAFAEDDIVFILAPAPDGNNDDGAPRYTLTMPRIRFVAQMPVYISFEVRDIELVDDDVTGGFSFAVDETTPYRNGAPYDPDGEGTYTIRNFRGRSTDGATLETSFDCHSMHVEYRGSR